MQAWDDKAKITFNSRISRQLRARIPFTEAPYLLDQKLREEIEHNIL